MLSIRVKYFLLAVLIESITLVTVAQSTFIQVISEPGISVFLDGAFKKITTSEMGGIIIENVSPGFHTIRIVKEGFAPQEERIEIKHGEVYSYKVRPFTPIIVITQQGNVVQQQIELKVGKIKIQSIPISITVSIPSLGIKYSKSSDEWLAYDIPAGEYDAIFIWNNRTLNSKIKVGDNQLTHLFINMMDEKVEDRSPNYSKYLPGSVTDTRDGFTYKTVTIGTQTWFAQNLNYFDENWDEWQSGHAICYGFNKENCQKFGRLYNWEIAMKVCPTGWHLPSNDEWITLISYLGGQEVAAYKLKSVTGWPDPEDTRFSIPRIKDNNESGFSALPGSKYLFSYFAGRDNISSSGYWWTSTKENDNNAYEVKSFAMHDWLDGIMAGKDDHRHLLSVRCLKNK